MRQQIEAHIVSILEEMAYKPHEDFSCSEDLLLPKYGFDSGNLLAALLKIDVNYKLDFNLFCNGDWHFSINNIIDSIV